MRSPHYSLGESPFSRPYTKNQEGMNRNPLQCYSCSLTGFSRSLLTLVGPLLQVMEVGEGTEANTGLQQGYPKSPRNVKDALSS